ncbi:MAG TPA: NAD-dependent epimerase/dehydratase family protein [Rhizomicrobium sp.]|nr:NAD-dependent epimerase/dehydratase family protein [Rhizomicrobium sp.]
MKWLVTGGCGFIGAALVRRLAAGNEHGIRIFDNLSVGKVEYLALPRAPRVLREPTAMLPLPDGGTVDVVVGDIRDAAATAKAAEGMDVIVHLAANTGVQPSIKNPRMDCEANVAGTLNILEAARAAGVKRFVMASSGAPLGDAEPPFDEETVARPISPYGASKLAGEAYCHAYAKSFGLETVPLRFSNVYGPGSDHKGSVVAAFMKRALARQSFVVNGDGQQTRDFIYLDDLLEALVAAATMPGVGGELFQIATGRETRVIDLAELLRSLLAEAGWNGIEIEYGAPLVGDARRNFATVAKAQGRLGWKPTIMLPEGLRRTVDWFKQQP